MKRITFIVGGGRCGKSRHALSLAQKYSGKRVFIATAEALDDEMKARIHAHQQERDESFVTIEEPLHLAGAIASVPADGKIVIIDCLTVWLGNLMYHINDDRELYKATRTVVDALAHLPCDVVVVSNEVGMGIVPENEMARKFRDIAGAVNQQIAAAANRVVLMVSGIAVTIKEETS